MIDNKLNFFFKGQIWHLGGIVILFYIGFQFVDLSSNTNTFLEIKKVYSILGAEQEIEWKEHGGGHAFDNDRDNASNCNWIAPSLRGKEEARFTISRTDPKISENKHDDADGDLENTW